MRILLINWQDRENPNADGAETHLHEVFGRLAGRGHEITLLASGWPGAAPRARLDGMEVHRTGGRYTFGIAAPAYYRRGLAGRRHDVVVEALNKVPLFAPAWADPPVVLLVHHLFGATAFREANLPLATLTWLLERPLPWTYRAVPALVISRSTAEDLSTRGLPRGNVRVAYPGVDLDFFTPGDPADRFPEPTFLYLGRLKRYKGVDLVIRAIARLAREGLPVRLIVAGKGEWEGRLRTLAAELDVADRVEFAGFVSEDRKRELFRRVHANVFPSPKEGWGITNLEAAACGTPTVASDSPGLRESVVDGETGFLVPHGDLAGLTHALRRYATSPALVREMGAAARDFAAAFTWERAADETERHLQRLIGDDARHRAAVRHPVT